MCLHVDLASCETKQPGPFGLFLTVNEEQSQRMRGWEVGHHLSVSSLFYTHTERKTTQQRWFWHLFICFFNSTLCFRPSRHGSHLIRWNDVSQAGVLYLKKQGRLLSCVHGLHCHSPPKPGSSVPPYALSPPTRLSNSSYRCQIWFVIQFYAPPSFLLALLLYCRARLRWINSSF